MWRFIQRERWAYPHQTKTSTKCKVFSVGTFTETIPQIKRLYVICEWNQSYLPQTRVKTKYFQKYLVKNTPYFFFEGPEEVLWIPDTVERVFSRSTFRFRQVPHVFRQNKSPYKRDAAGETWFWRVWSIYGHFLLWEEPRRLSQTIYTFQYLSPDFLLFFFLILNTEFKIHNFIDKQNKILYNWPLSMLQ